VIKMTDRFVECDNDTLIAQIGAWYVLSIAGSLRRVEYRQTGVTLPVRYGYAVTIDLAPGDTYTVRRVYRKRNIDEWTIKGEETNVYCDAVADSAYRASCFRDPFGEPEQPVEPTPIMPAEFVTIEQGDIECVCSNDAASDRFVSSRSDGTIVAPDSETWDGTHLVCASCGRIIDQLSGRVVGKRDPRGVVEAELAASDAYASVTADIDPVREPSSPYMPPAQPPIRYRCDQHGRADLAAPCDWPHSDLIADEYMRAAADRAEGPDRNGAFDGNIVVSDADSGL